MSLSEDFTDEQGRRVCLGRKIGGGGEGDILEVSGEPSLVAKVYRKPTEKHTRKLEAMQRNPPPAPGSTTGHISICWPQRLLFSRSGAGAGFLMPRVDLSRSYELFKLYNHASRVGCLPGFTWAYLLRSGANLARVVAAVHARGYVIGDLNESNLLVTRSALIVMVDCDSMQVPAPGGGCFRCPVGKPEFTAPELQGRDFSTIDRTPAHDRFALGVMLFHMLMEGFHPFAGVWKDTATEEPQIGTRIRDGYCPYTGSPLIDPPPSALPFDILPAQLRSLFDRCFRACEGAEARPTAQEWFAALAESQSKVRVCSRNSQHVYGAHNEICPWCERAQRLGSDPFPPLQPSPSQQQIPMPPVDPPRPPSSRTSGSDRGDAPRKKFGARADANRDLGIVARAPFWAHLGTLRSVGMTAAAVLFTAGGTWWALHHGSPAVCASPAECRPQPSSSSSPEGDHHSAKSRDGSSSEHNTVTTVPGPLLVTPTPVTPSVTVVPTPPQGVVRAKPIGRVDKRAAAAKKKLNAHSQLPVAGTTAQQQPLNGAYPSAQMPGTAGGRPPCPVNPGQTRPVQPNGVPCVPQSVPNMSNVARPYGSSPTTPMAGPGANQSPCPVNPQSGRTVPCVPQSVPSMSNVARPYGSSPTTPMPGPGANRPPCPVNPQYGRPVPSSAVPCVPQSAPNIPGVANPYGSSSTTPMAGPGVNQPPSLGNPQSVQPVQPNGAQSVLGAPRPQQGQVVRPPR